MARSIQMRLSPMHNDLFELLSSMSHGEPLTRGIHLWGVKWMVPASHQCSLGSNLWRSVADKIIPIVKTY